MQLNTFLLLVINPITRVQNNSSEQGHQRDFIKLDQGFKLPKIVRRPLEEYQLHPPPRSTFENSMVFLIGHRC